MTRRLPLLLIALALAGCGGAHDDAPSADEARQLNEAAAATDINAMRADNSAEAQP
jgi:outer membrane PBP1 activator LpoA protein